MNSRQYAYCSYPSQEVTNDEETQRTGYGGKGCSNMRGEMVMIRTI
nr:MAG TPA: hypothetical protein [Caudoviricetes sp.]